jgi:PAS domain S-box-containing protein
MAILAVAAALVLRLGIDPWLPDDMPLTTLYGAVALTVWYGGYRPALLAAAIGYVAGNFLFIHPRFTFAVEEERDVAELFLFSMNCLIIITMGQGLRNARRRAEAGQRDLLRKQQQLEQEAAIRQRAEQELRISEAWFKTLASHAPVGIFQTDDEGNCLYVNERWCDMGGMPADAARGQGWVAALHPDDRDRVFHEWYTAVKAGRGFVSEYRFQTPQGKVIWLSGTSVALRDETGKISGYLGTITDITALKQAEEELRQRAEENEKMMEIVPLGVFIAHDPACRRITGNLAGYELMRLPAGSNLSVTPPPGESPPFAVRRDGKPLIPDELPMQYAAAHAIPVHDVEVEHVYPDGTTYTLFGSAAPLFDAQGKVRGCVASFLDITERKRLESELRHRVEQLALADRRKDEFLAMLAHELRNPLAPIRTAADIMRVLAPADKNIQRAREMIDRQIQHLTRLVDDLLDVSRITQGKITLHREKLDLAAVVARAAETSRPSIEARRHQLTITLPPEAVCVQGDATRLAQVLANLLDNAAKYTPDGGHIELAVSESGVRSQGSGVWGQGSGETALLTPDSCLLTPEGGAILSVRDNGMGIAADLLPHVFDLFTQGECSLARSAGGLGIGLSMVKRLVEMHGGSVEGRSAGPDQGSEFIVRLPLSRSQESGVRSQEPAIGPSSLTPDSCLLTPGRRVLVVDDNTDAVASLAILLQAGGHQVQTAHDGPAALEAAQVFQPEVVLLDIGLPGMSGYEVARQLRRQPGLEKTRLVAVTGYGQEEDRRQAQAAGFDAHLVKPADLTAIAQLLAGSETKP